MLYTSIKFVFAPLHLGLCMLGVRKRGNSVNRSSKDWQMPEIRHNMGERLTLFDPIARCSREVDLARCTYI